MADKIDQALVKQLNDRGAAVYDTQGKLDLTASQKKLKEISAGTSAPTSFGVPRQTNVVAPGPTVIRTQLPKEEKEKLSLNTAEQKLSNLAMARQVIQKNLALGQQEQGIRGMVQRGVADTLSDPNKMKTASDVAGGVISAGLSPNPVFTAITTIPKLREKVAPVAVKFAGDIARAPLRALTSVGIEPVAGAIGAEPIFTPKTKVEKMVYGEEPIKGIFKQTSEAQDWLDKQFQKRGLAKDTSLGLSMGIAPLFVAGMTGLDLTPFGGEKNTAKLVAKSKNADEIVGLIKNIFKNDDPAIVRSFAEMLSEINNPRLVEEFIAKKVAQKAAGIAQDVSKTAKQVAAVEKINESPIEKVIETAATLDTSKQRKFITTVLDSDKTSPELKQAVAKIPDKTYDPITNKETFDEAKDFVDSGYQEAYDYFKNTDKQDVRYVAVGQTLAKQASDAGRFEEAVGIIEDLAAFATRRGQEVQAFSVWDKMSPEGMLYFAQREINKANDVIDKKFLGIGKSLRKKIPNLTEDEAKIIVDKMKQAQSMTDEKEKAQAIKEVFELINNKIPLGFSDLFTAYRYQNMLSSPRTQLRNIFGNVTETFLLQPAKMLFESPIDFIQSAYSGTPRKRELKDIPVYYKNVLNAFPNAVDALKDVWAGKTNIDLMNPDFAKMRMDKLPKKLTIVSRGMEGMDQFFKTLVGSGVKAVELSKGKTETEALAEASRVSNYSLFKGALDPKNKTGQGELLSKIDSITALINQAGQKLPLFNWFVPFVNTPMRFAKKWVEYTPGLGLATLPGNVRKTEQLAKQAMGSTVMLFGATLAMQDKTTWAPPKGEEDRKAFYAQGKKPYSVNINGHWVPMIYFGPLALALAIPAAVKYRFQDAPEAMTDTVIEKTMRSVGSVFELFSQQTFLQGMGKYINLISGGTDYDAPAAAAFTVAQTIPMEGLVKWVNDFFIDPTYRKTSGFKEGLMAALPFATKGLTPVETPEGEEAKREWYNAFTPWDIIKNNEKYEEIVAKRQEAAQLRRVITKQEAAIDKELGEIARDFKIMNKEERKKTIKEIVARGGMEELKDLLGKIKKRNQSKEVEYAFYRGLDSNLRAYFIKKDMDAMNGDKAAMKEYAAEMIKNKILTEESMKVLITMIKQQKNTTQQ